MKLVHHLKIFVLELLKVADHGESRRVGYGRSALNTFVQAGHRTEPSWFDGTRSCWLQSGHETVIFSGADEMAGFETASSAAEASNRCEQSGQPTEPSYVAGSRSRRSHDGQATSTLTSSSCLGEASSEGDLVGRSGRLVMTRATAMITPPNTAPQRTEAHGRPTDGSSGGGPAR